MASRTIAIRITIDNKEAINNAKAQVIAMKGVEDATKRQTQLQDGLTNSFIKGNLAARGISITYNLLKDSLTEVLKSAIQFEFTMAKIQAISGESASAVHGLSDTVQDLALNSNKSAVEIGKAALEMGKIGLSTPQVKLLLGSVVSLSTALDEDLVKSGEAVVSILNTYGDSVLEGKKRTEELAFTVGASALTMDSFSTAFAYVGATAKLAGVKFEDLTAAMDVLSNSGVRASTIGTQLRRIIADLSDENSKASKAIGGTIESLGGLIPAMEKLRQVTPKGDDGVAFLTDKFGRTATSVAAILALNTDEMKRLSAATESSTGSLDRMQGIMNDTFLAKWEHFLNITKSLGSGPLLVLKAALSGVNDALDGTKGFLDEAIKAQHDFLTAADTKKSVAKGGGFGDLLLGDKDKVKDQIAEVDKLLKQKKEMEGPDGDSAKKSDEILDRIKTDFEVFKTFGGSFDFKNANKQLKDLADNLLKVGDAKDAIKVMRELRAIQGEQTRQENPKNTDVDAKRTLQDRREASGLVSNARDERKIIADEKADKRAQDSLTEYAKKYRALLALREQHNKFLTESSLAFAGTAIGVNSLTQSIDALSGSLVGLESFGKAMKAILQSLAAQVVSTLIKFALFQGIVAALGIGTGGFGFTATGGLSDALLKGLGGVAAPKFATGTDQVVRTPTLFVAGDAGAERVRVTPRAKMSESGSDSGGGMTFIIQGDVYDYDKFQRKVKAAQDSHKRSYV